MGNIITNEPIKKDPAKMKNVLICFFDKICIPEKAVNTPIVTALFNLVKAHSQKRMPYSNPEINILFLIEKCFSENKRTANAPSVNGKAMSSVYPPPEQIQT